MKIIYIIVAAIAALYLVGCYLAYGAVQTDNSMRAADSKYGQITIARRTLGSWWTVCSSLLASLGSVK